MSRAPSRQDLKARWEQLIALLNSSREENTFDFLFSVAYPRLLSQAQSKLNAIDRRLKTEGLENPLNQILIKTLTKAYQAQAAQVHALRNMNRNPSSRFIDDAIISMLLQYYGVPFTFVIQAENKAYIPRQIDPPGETIPCVARYAIRAIGSSTRDPTARQGHFESGSFCPQSNSFDWNGTPRDGNCGLHAVLAVLTAAAPEASRYLQLDPPKSAPLLNLKDLNQDGSITPTEINQIERFIAADKAVEIATRKRLAQLDKDKLATLTQHARAQYPDYACLDNTDPIAGLTILFQALNHHQNLDSSSAERLVGDVISTFMGAQGVSNAQASACGLFAPTGSEASTTLSPTSTA